MEITFREHRDPSYVGRTKENASADATIAIAANFNSAGEKLTKKLVEEQKKVYIPIDISKELDLSEDLIKNIVKKLNCSTKGNLIDNSIILNIAGNGIYALKNRYTQELLDSYLRILLLSILASKELKVKIKLIRTGGQTGLDEAGAKAGVFHEIPTLVVCPYGWKYRNLLGEDIADETQFKNRFLL